jgi:hypothetical protein
VVAHGVLKTVLLVLRVEVAAGALEVRCVADGLGVDVDGVLAYGEVFEIELDGELVFALAEGGGAGVFSGAGFDGDDENIFGVGGFGEDWGGKEAK